MESHLTEEALWASNVSARLRLMQANFADDQSSVRLGFLTEEIQRALKGIAENKREAYLDALAQRFPTWEAAIRLQPIRTENAVTPDAVLAQFLEVAASLPRETRLEWTKKLQDAGMAPQSTGSPLLEVPQDLQKRLGLAPGQPLSPERAVRMIAALSDLVLTLDQLIWTLWRQVAPKSTIRKEVDIAKMTGQYLAGSPDVSTPQLVQSMEKTRKMIAGLLGAVGRAGSDYARKHASRFAPEVIEDFAKMESGWVGTEVKCWRKYVQLAKEHATEPAIENEIQEAIAKTAENLVIGRTL
jgi:hypothetical protein